MLRASKSFFEGEEEDFVADLEAAADLQGEIAEEVVAASSGGTCRPRGRACSGGRGRVFVELFAVGGRRASRGVV